MADATTEAAVARLLRRCGPGLERRYGRVFQRHEIDAVALRLCSEADLRDVLGVSQEDSPALLAAASHLVDCAAGDDDDDGVLSYPLPEEGREAEGAEHRSIGGGGREGRGGGAEGLSSIPGEAPAEEAASPSPGCTPLASSAGMREHQKRDSIGTTEDASRRGDDGNGALLCHGERSPGALLLHSTDNSTGGGAGSMMSLEEEEEERQSSAAGDPQAPRSCRKRRDAFGVLMMGSAKAARRSAATGGAADGTSATDAASASASAAADDDEGIKDINKAAAAGAAALPGSRSRGDTKGPGGAHHQGGSSSSSGRSRGAAAGGGHWAALGSRAPSRPPPWKTVPGTDFVVDGFFHCGPWSKNFFLSHFHADHYGGLDRSFSAGTVFCTHETARLVRMHLGVPKQRIVSLEINKTHRIDGKAVTLVEANHCPGAVIFVFQIGTCTHVHCGDMRFEPSLLSEDFPVGLGGIRIDNLYLDTTYCDPRYAFPRQAEVLKAVDAIVRLEESRAAGSKKKAGERVLYICGAYTIGKEKVWLQVFRSLGNTGAIHADPRRRRTLECLDLPRVLAALADEHCSPRRSFSISASSSSAAASHDDAKDGDATALRGGGGGGSAGGGTMLGLRRTSAAVRVTSDAASREASVRVAAMGALSDSALHETLSSAPVKAAGFTRVVAFRPTGWSFRPPDRAQTKLTAAASVIMSSAADVRAPQSSAAIAEGVGGSVRSVGAGGRITVVSLPYSEHSSVEELQEMVRVLRPRRILPTVAKNAQHRSEILRLLTGSDGPPVYSKQ